MQDNKTRKVWGDLKVWGILLFAFAFALALFSWFALPMP